jgi:hypothetical protein
MIITDMREKHSPFSEKKDLKKNKSAENLKKLHGKAGFNEK